MQNAKDQTNLKQRLATSVAVAATIMMSAASASAQASDEVGVWGPQFDFPVVPIHAMLAPDGRVMLYGAEYPDDPPYLLNELQYVIWDPTLGTGPASQTLMDNNLSTDTFCGSQIVIPLTGELFTAGGDAADQGNNNANTTFFNPATNTLTAGTPMAQSRWYPTTITLANGELLQHGGSTGNESGAPILTPEIYNPATGQWRSLTGATSDFAYGEPRHRWWYPRTWVLSDGRVFTVSDNVMYFLDPTGAGEITEAGLFNTSNTTANSTAVMFAPDQVLQVGGGHFSANGNVPASPLASIIDISGANPVITPTQSPNLARAWADTTLLPTGEVVLSGGSQINNSLNQGHHSVSEMWDPDTGEWTLLADEEDIRLYHSQTVLLPDGTIYSGGGGSPGPVLQNNGRIFFPPYLFNGNSLAPRPSYDLAGDDFEYGETLTMSVSGPNPVVEAVLMKTTAITHSFNVEQRRIELPLSVSGGSATVTLPDSPNDATPGFYMLFLIDSAGTPSVADIIRVIDEDSISTVPTAPPIGGVSQVADGDFNSLQVPNPANFLEFAAGANIGPWAVTNGTVALHGATHRGLSSGTGAPGGQVISLQPGSSGSIAQDISGLVPGQNYTLTVYYALHDFGEPTSASLNVNIANVDEVITSTNVGTDEWVAQNFTFTASSATETLSYEALSTNGSEDCCGVLIDGISIALAGASAPPTAPPTSPTPTGPLVRVRNRNFERPVITPAGRFDELTVGDRIGAWTVTNGTVALQGTNHRGLSSGTGAPGGQTVSLQPGSGGTIAQDISGLVPGDAYTLTVSYALHDFGDPTNATLNVNIGNLDTVITSTTVGTDAWETQTFAFIAGSTSETLTYAALSSNGAEDCCGILIDRVLIREGSSGFPLPTPSSPPSGPPSGLPPVGIGNVNFNNPSITPASGFQEFTAGENLGPWDITAGTVAVQGATHRGL